MALFLGQVSWSAVLAAWLAVGFLVYLRWWRKHPLYGSNIPAVYPVLGSFLLMLANKHRILDWATELLRSAPGHTIRTVRPGGAVTLMTANPANVEHILMRRFDNYPKGRSFTDVVQELLGKGIFGSDGHLWRIQRKVASREFTTRSLRELVYDTLDAHTRHRMLPLLHKAAAAGSDSVVDLQDMFMRLSFDTICLIAFGVDPACLPPQEQQQQEQEQEQGTSSSFAQAFDAATALSGARFLALTPLLWKAKRALNVGSERKLRQAMAVVNSFAASVIRARRKQLAHAEGVHAEHLDLLSRFIRLVESDRHSQEAQELEQIWSASTSGTTPNSSQFADEFLRDIVISFVIAGRDTSSVALSWFFWLLSRHPEVEESVHSEILAVLRARKAGGDQAPAAAAAGALTYDELKGMHYLTAALWESLRLYPPVPVDSKEAKEADVLPDGTAVAKGARVGYHPYAMGRMESIWGPDCLHYKPDRWLRGGQFQPQLYSAFQFPVFQAGPRVCLGKDMAMLQMKFVAAACIRHFAFAVTPADYQPTYRLALTMPMIHGLPATVRLRL